MAKMRYNRNGWQRVINTVKERSSSTIKKIILEETEKWKDLQTILSTMNGKDFKTAADLLYADPEVSQVIGKVVCSDIQDEQIVQTGWYNKTRILREENRKIKEQQEKELQEKIQQLKNMRAA